MKLVVWKIGRWRPSRFEDGDNLVVAFKGIDKDNTGKTYHLNVNSLMRNKDDWLRACIEGNVLELSILPGTTGVSRYAPFHIVKQANGKEATDEEGNLPGQVELI